MKPAVKKPRDPRPITELALHKYVVQLLAAAAKPGVIWWHCPNGELRDKATAKKLQAMGVRPGVSDIHVAMPGRWFGVIELKSGTGSLSAEQRAFLDGMATNGFITRVCRTPESVKEVLLEWGAIRKVK